MATTFQPLYANGGSRLTITLTALANAAYRQSDTMINTVALWLDAQMTLRITTTATGVTSSGTVEIYGFANVQDAKSPLMNTDTAGTADGASAKPNNARLIGVMQCNSNAAMYVGGPFSVANAFGGTLPPSWGIIVGNLTGAQLTNSANHLCFLQGYQEQGV